MMFKHIKNNRGLTVIELLVATVVSSILLIMLMQLLLINTRTQNVTEYENFLTDEALFITEQIQTELLQFEPHGYVLDDTSDPNLVTITFYHEYNVIFDNSTPGKVFIDLDQVNDTMVLEYDISAETISLDGVVLHSSTIKVLSTSSIVDTYFSNNGNNGSHCVYMVDAGCTDHDNDWDNRIIGDGVLRFNLEIAVEYGNGTRGDTFTFTTQLII